MARIMTKSKPVIEGSTGIKFTEIIVVAMALAGIFVGVKKIIEYRNGPSFALTEFMGAVKAGNPQNQFDLIDENDKKTNFTNTSYPKFSLAHGYTERIENTSLSAEQPTSDPNKVTISMTTTIRASAAGKQLYENGQKQTYTDTMVMRKNKDGKWRVVLSASLDKSTGKLHLQEAPASADSGF